MKVYNIKVNGKVFEVEVETVKEENRSMEKPASAPVSSNNQVPAGGQEILAPMAGTILKVNINVGDTVKKGDVVVILEAMKLENEIRSQFDGVVKSIDVTKGQAVTLKQKIAVIG